MVLKVDVVLELNVLRMDLMYAPQLARLLKP